MAGWAVGYHAEPRFTKDLDVFIGPSNENLDAVARALARFGAPAAIVDTLRGLGPDEAARSRAATKGWAQRERERSCLR